MLPLQDVLDRNFHLLLWKANLSVMKSPGFTKGHVHLPPVLNILCSGGTKIFFMFAPHPKLSSRQQLSLKAMMVHARTHNVQIQWSIVDATHGLFFPPMWWHAVCNTGCRQVMNDTLTYSPPSHTVSLQGYSHCITISTYVFPRASPKNTALAQMCAFYMNQRAVHQKQWIETLVDEFTKPSSVMGVIHAVSPTPPASHLTPPSPQLLHPHTPHHSTCISTHLPPPSHSCCTPHHSTCLLIGAHLHDTEQSVSEWKPTCIYQGSSATILWAQHLEVDHQPVYSGKEG